MSFPKSQGKKQEGSHNNSHQQKQQNRNNNNGNNNNNNKKWTNNSASRNHASSSPVEPIHEDSTIVKQLHDRMLFLLGNLTGCMVEVTVKDGCKFKGVFHGASTEGDLGIALKLAQKIYDPTSPIDKDKTNPNPIKNTLLIFSKDLVEVNAANVDFASSEISDRNTFKTDTDISGRSDIKERELYKWTPTEDEGNKLLDGSLESTESGSWDQFAANEKLFGLKTDFDEEMYTTPLNRSAPGYKDREKRAIKVANEIQKTATNNVHMLEERGLAIDDSGMDEEDLYGAVVRESNPNKYVPPALRKQPQQQRHQQSPKKEKTAGPLNKLITSDLPRTASNPSPIANLPTTRRESSDKKRDKSNNSNSNEPPQRIEAEIATTFKHFAMLEKDKLNAKKQALQKKEKDGRLAELKAFHQSFKLNVPIPADLVPLLSKKKNNNAETSSPEAVHSSPSKKTTPPPTKKAAAAPSSTSASPAPVAASTTTAPASAPPPATAQPVTATSPKPASPAPASPSATNTNAASSSPATSNSFKFNVKASSFKPNPSAAAFVPGGGASATSSDDHQHHQNSPQSAFASRQVKRGGPIEPMTMSDAFVPPFLENDQPASTVGPTWPFGHKSYRVQFSQFGYDEDMYNYPSPNYGYYPQYRYPFPQMPYAQFVQPTMPPTYSPQMANVSPHGSPFPQGFPSPQRSPMVPQQMPPQIYQYNGAPMMMRYPPDMMMQRPVMVETVPYHHQQDTSATDSGAETPPPPPPPGNN